MPYSRWNNERLDELKDQKLFKECLLKDIKKGQVFPAIRRSQIHFYHHGCKLFGYTGKYFESNAKFILAYKKKPRDYVRESELKQVELIKNFTAGYEQIKNNVTRFADPEAAEVAKLCRKFSYAKKDIDVNGPIVLDTELSLQRTQGKRAQDRIDLVLYFNQEIRFFEVKLLKDARLRSKGNSQPEVLDQLARYNSHVNDEKENRPLLDRYCNYVEKVNQLFGIKIKKPKKLASNVDLLVFGFGGGPKDKKSKNKIVNTVNDEKNATHCYAIGNANNVRSATIRNWFQKKN